jgi:hypothetical protein
MFTRVLGAAWLSVGLATFAFAQPATAPATQPASRPSSLPHITVDLKARHVDLEAKVILRDAEWIELLACTPKSGREHEAILSTPARPSHIHLALVMLGLEPGSPMRYWREGDEFKSAPPKGPRVEVLLRYTKDGKPVEVPANRWILNQKTGKALDDRYWIFTGSQTGVLDDQTIYHADLNGTAISVVNFGGDLLTRATELTDKTDEATWGCHTAEIPPLDTEVTIRIRPVKEEDGGVTK